MNINTSEYYYNFVKANWIPKNIKWLMYGFYVIN